MILLSIVLYFIFPYLILFLYSSKYFDSIYLAQIYLITLPATAYALFLQDFLSAFRAEDLMIKIKLVFTLLNLLLYFLLIPIYGMAGAIVASIIYYNLLALVMGYFSWKK
jgi:O-antigen/teichoic acid export membrane protein